jgi:Sec-independent protein secretion pathway component TatC
MTPIAASVLMVMWAVLLLMLLGVGVWSVFTITARRRPSRARSRRS